MDIDEILLPDELEDEEYIMDQISGIEDESDYDSDDDTPNVENDYGLYNAGDEDLLVKADEDIDEKELAEVLDGEDLEITVSQIVNTAFRFRHTIRTYRCVVVLPTQSVNVRASSILSVLLHFF